MNKFFVLQLIDTKHHYSRGNFIKWKFCSCWAEFSFFFLWCRCLFVSFSSIANFVCQSHLRWLFKHRWDNQYSIRFYQSIFFGDYPVRSCFCFHLSWAICHSLSQVVRLRFIDTSIAFLLLLLLLLFLFGRLLWTTRTDTVR